MLKVAYLTGEYLRPTHTFIMREVDELRRQGFDVHTFSVRKTVDKDIVSPEQKAEKEKTFYILPPNLGNLFFSHLLLFLTSPLNYLQSLKLAWMTRQLGLTGLLYQLFYFAEAGILAQELRRRGITHLHNHLPMASGTVAMLAASLGKFTYSCTVHGPHIFYEPYRWHLPEKVKRALFVICISHFCRSQLMYMVPLSYWSKLHIVHCGIELNKFSAVVHQTSQKRLLHIGRLAAEKGLPILLQSLSVLVNKHPDLLLTVIGDGKERQAMEALVVSLKLESQVQFIGYVSPDEVSRYLSETDVFVLPSFAEGLPVSLMEAMASEVPVVTTRIAGIGELVEDGFNGYLVSPGDSAALAQKIDILLSDPDLRRQFGLRGRQKVEAEFNLSQEASSLGKIFSSYLAPQMLSPAETKDLILTHKN